MDIFILMRIVMPWYS